MNESSQQFRIANNQAVMRALGIEHLGHMATRITLEMEAGSFPQLTVHMHVAETDPACHLHPHGSAEPFDLDRACQEALGRVNQHIRWLASAARVETKNDFQDARLSLYRRWGVI